MTPGNVLATLVEQLTLACLVVGPYILSITFIRFPFKVGKDRKVVGFGASSTSLFGRKTGLWKGISNDINQDGFVRNGERLLSLRKVVVTRSIKKSTIVGNSSEDVFDALITPSRINDWWKSTTAIVNPKAGGIWMASWGENIDDPDYVTSAVMSVFEIGKRIVMTDYDYTAKSGPLPFDASFETTFDIQTLTNKQTELIVEQSGFPLDESANDFLAGCTQGWEDTLANLKEHLENGKC